MIRNLFGKREAGSGVLLDREDNERREQLARSVRRVRVSRSLLGLAWTAGPVTALGLYGGYYIGFGHAPSRELLTYFISFTVLSGLIGLTAKVVYDSTWGHASDLAQRNAEEVIDKLSDLILAVRNLTIDAHDGEIRRREAAVHLLERVDLSPGGVALACEELTGDAELARLLSEIDTFRRAGLYARIEDLHAEHNERFEAVVAEMHQVSPPAANILRQRYLGEIGQLRHGVPRSEHFVERVLAAIEQDNPLLITMSDVESMLVLAFELINGREIPMLIFHYRGRWRLAAALDRMERRRSRYRIVQAAASNRIRALASWLVEIDALDYEAVPEGVSTAVLIEEVMRAIDNMDISLQLLVSRYQVGDMELRSQLKQQAEAMASALRLYGLAHAAYEGIGRVHADFLAAAEDWNRLLKRAHEGPEMLQFGPGRRGLRIIEKTVALGDDERKEVCNQLVVYLREQKLKARETKTGFTQKVEQERPLTFDSARQLAVELALLLEPHVHLSYPEIQRGIGATYAAYFGDLEPGLSAQEKKTLAEAMAQDVQEDLSRAAEHLALALVRHYRVELTPEACDFLHQTYGARRSVLDILSQYHGEMPPTQSPLSTRPAVVLRARRRWYRTLVQARRLIGG